MGKCAICLKKIERGTGPFFQVPRDDEKRLLWERNCRMQFRNKDFVCANHFTRGDMICGGKKARLLPKAIPYVDSAASTNNMATAQQPSGLGLRCVQSSLVSTMNVCTEEDTNRSASKTEACSHNYYAAKDIETQTTAVFVEDCETQTDCIIFEALIAPEVKLLKKEVKRLKEDPQIRVLKREVARLEKENNDLRHELEKSNVVLDNFRKIFTEGQMRKMITPERNIHWHWKDISNAICLSAAGPRAYHHLYAKGFPLPHVSTLQRWSRKADVSEGLISASYHLLENISYLKDSDKICVISFDEMKVAETYEYDQLGDHVRKPVNYVQMVMARGLLKSWMQPVFYAFDTQMTKDILNSIIAALYNINFPVVAVVSDMGPTNRKVWKQFNVTHDNPWFTHPSDEGSKVFVFADAPHLLKLVRNHYIDDDILWEGQRLTTRTICDLLNHTSDSDVSIAYKISHDHLSVKGAARQKVSTAAQLFSHKIASAIRYCYAAGFDLYKPLETADFIQLVNDWFDVLNSDIGTFAYPGKKPFGRDLPNQMEVLNRMNEFMSAPIIPGKKGLEIFQKGIIMTNRALVGLYDYLKSKSNVEYILTYRLNQDILENFFAALRGDGGFNDHPTPKDFHYRLRKYVLAGNTESLRGTGNVAKDMTEWLAPQGTSTPFLNRSLNVSASSSGQINNLRDESSGQVNNLCDEDGENKENREMDDTQMPSEDIEDDCGILHEQGLAYVSGYIIKKLKLEELRDFGPSFGYIDQVSKGSLKKPSSQLLQGVKSLEKIFYKINAKEISHCDNLHKRLVERSAHLKVPERVKHFFFKCRINYRIRDLNKKLRVKKAKQRIMGYKKFLKIKL